MTSVSTKLPKIELHLHLDGAVRAETVWELLKEKSPEDLPGDGSLEALRKALVVTEPCSLAEFLSHFVYIAKAIGGDVHAIERIAYELCEDKAKDGVVYMEPRYSPHLMLDGAKDGLTVRDVVRAINRGLKRGQKDFDIKCRSILVILRGHPSGTLSSQKADDRMERFQKVALALNDEWSLEIIELCEEFKDDGLVAIDIAGLDNGHETVSEEDIRAFELARQKGIHRTAHAGESGPASSVKTAMETLGAERIGHGYHVIEDEEIYSDAKRRGMHFETCPYSSILTGAVPETVDKHPIIRFCEDGVSFSVSTDDPTITGKLLSDDYQKLLSLGLTEDQLFQANINAIKVAFLPPEEKDQLLEKFQRLHSG